MLIKRLILPVKAAEKGKWRFNSLLWQCKNVKKGYCKERLLLPIKCH